jgi:hypothetical protein
MVFRTLPTSADLYTSHIHEWEIDGGPKTSPNYFIVASNWGDTPFMSISFPFSGSRLVIPVAPERSSDLRLASPLSGSRLVMPVAPERSSDVRFVSPLSGSRLVISVAPERERAV